MEIRLTKDQFLALLKTVYLGNWLANAVRTDTPDDKRKEAFDEIEDYMFSRAEEFGAGDLVEYDAEMRRHVPTLKLEGDGEIQECIDRYNEENFWEELVYRLVDRDFSRMYTDEGIRVMSASERIEKDHPLFEKYWEEFETNGIERLQVVHLNDDLPA